jgi:dihydrofolate synthase/folylpolyglutamate synthase
VLSSLERLLGRQPSTRIRWGLERIQAVLRDLGEPHRRFRSIHVGGTNGKGSVAATAASVLRHHGLAVGLYTSPHLVHFRERICVGGGEVDSELLETCAAEVLPLAEREEASFFEAATALAFHCFACAGVELAVVEVGLGGRLDATNVVDPEVTLVTNVSFDHSEYLGHSLEAIAAEKAGILKRSAPAVVGPLPDRLLEVFAARAEAVGTSLRVLGRETAVESVQVNLAGTSLTYRSPAFPDGLHLRTPLVGSHQAVNAALALQGLEQLGISLDPEAVSEGVAQVTWPGRFQVLSRPDGDWLLDLAHNTAAAAALAETLRQVTVERPLVMLLAILGDKPWREMLDPLLSTGMAAVFSVAPSSPQARRWNPRVARQAVPGHRVVVEPVFERALRQARELAGRGTVVVTGSCHTVGDALRFLDAV